MTKAERQLWETWLRAERVAYIDVRSAARAVLPDGPRSRVSGPIPFHYVLYGQQNLLLWFGKRRPAVVRLMTRWEELFGEGFTACFGEFPAGAGRPSFVSLRGTSMDVLVYLGKRTLGSAAPSPTSPSCAPLDPSVKPQGRIKSPFTESTPTLFPIANPNLHRERH